MRTNLLSFNINSDVFVKLKPEGFEHWQKEYNKYLPDHMKKPLSYFVSKQDDHFYVEFQLWEFMQIFGNTISHGTPPIFVNDILFKKDDFKEL